MSLVKDVAKARKQAKAKAAPKRMARTAEDTQMEGVEEGNPPTQSQGPSEGDMTSLILGVGKMSLKVLRRMEQLTIRTFLFKEETMNCWAKMDQVSKDWHTHCKQDKTAGPPGRVLILTLMELALENFGHCQSKIGVMYPEYQENLTPEVLLETKNRLVNDLKMVDYLSPHCVWIITKRDKKRLLRIAPGRGRVAPPFYPIPMPADALLDIMLAPFQGLEELDQAPRQPLERKLDALLKKYKKPDTVEADAVV